MSLRLKVILIIIFGSILSFLTIFAFSNYFLQKSFIAEENREVTLDIKRVNSSINSRIRQLISNCSDWARWNDSYKFVVDRNIKFIDDNLVDESFNNLRVNLIVFVDLSGKIVFAKAYDLENKKEVALPKQLEKLLASGSRLLSHEKLESSVSGIISLPEGPMMVASFPIITSKMEGPIRGTLIMGRFLDSLAIQELVSQTQLDFSVYQSSSSTLPKDFKSALSELLSNKEYVVHPLGQEQVAGYSIINDIDEAPVLIARVVVPRDIYSQGLIINKFFQTILLVLVVLIVLAFIFIIEKTILARLFSLISDVARIGKTTDLSARVHVTDKDELASLGGEINKMLSGLEKLSKELERAQKEKFDSVVHDMADGVIVCSPKWAVTEINLSAKKLLNLYDVENLNLLDYFFQNFAVSTTKEKILNLAVQHKKFELKREETEQFKPLYIEVDLDILDKHSESADFVMVLRDVTAERETEQLQQEFLSLISHKIRLPSSVVFENISLLKDELAGPLTAGQKEMLLSLETKAHTLVDIIVKMITFTTISAYKRNVHVENVPIFESLTRILNPFISAKNAKKINIAIDCPDKEASIIMNGEHFSLIISNLIDNSIKFNDKQFVEIKISVVNSKDVLEIVFTDNSRGIPSEDQEKIFEKFYQVEKYFTGQVEGVGLGLALVKIIVELWGGKVSLISEIGQGSTFTLTFPKQ